MGEEANAQLAAHVDPLHGMKTALGASGKGSGPGAEALSTELDEYRKMKKDKDAAGSAADTKDNRLRRSVPEPFLSLPIELPLRHRHLSPRTIVPLRPSCHSTISTTIFAGC